MAKQTNKLNQIKIIRKKSVPARVKDAITALIGQQYGGGFGQQHMISVTPGQPIQISRDFLALAVNGYSENPWFHKSCNIIISAASAIPLVVKRKESGEWVDDIDHPLNQTIEWPNDDQSRVEFVETALLQAILTGNAFTHKAKPLNHMTLLRPDKVKIIPGDDGRVDHYEYTANENTGKVDTYNPEEIWHFMMIDPINSIDGVSPAEAAAGSIYLNNMARMWNKSKLENTTGLGGVFFGTEPLNENQTQQIETKIEEYSGPQNVAKYALLDGISDFKALSETTKEMDWLNVMDQSSHEIAMTMGVPKELLFGQATYENMDQAMRQLYTRTVIPLMTKFVAGLNHFMAADYGTDVRIDMELESITVLQEDMAAKAGWLLPLALNRVILLNELRDKLGFEAREDCEIFLEPQNLLPVNPNEPIREQQPPFAQPVPAAPPMPAAGLMATIEEIKQMMNH